MKVRFIVPRVSNDEFTFAIVKADVSVSELKNEVSFLEALTSAMTEWRKTKTGKEAWKRASGDFNVGDLAGELPPYPTLARYLADRGITNLEIECVVESSQCQNWTYDTILMKKE